MSWLAAKWAQWRLNRERRAHAKASGTSSPSILDVLMPWGFAMKELAKSAQEKEYQRQKAQDEVSRQMGTSEQGIDADYVTLIPAAASLGDMNGSSGMCFVNFEGLLSCRAAWSLFQAADQFAHQTVYADGPLTEGRSFIELNPEAGGVSDFRSLRYGLRFPAPLVGVPSAFVKGGPLKSRLKNTALVGIPASGQMIMIDGVLIAAGATDTDYIGPGARDPWSLVNAVPPDTNICVVAGQAIRAALLNFVEVPPLVFLGEYVGNGYWDTLKGEPRDRPDFGAVLPASQGLRSFRWFLVGFGSSMAQYLMPVGYDVYNPWFSMDRVAEYVDWSTSWMYSSVRDRYHISGRMYRDAFLTLCDDVDILRTFRVDVAPFSDVAPVAGNTLIKPDRYRKMIAGMNPVRMTVRVYGPAGGL